MLFLSTPSARRATYIEVVHPKYLPISIHALREEGDLCGSDFVGEHSDFYPRPPRGGRRGPNQRPAAHRRISIHALREEGDCPF